MIIDFMRLRSEELKKGILIVISFQVEFIVGVSIGLYNVFCS
jgi:hypothetical protein